jgi:hypothetical protein
MRTEDRERIRVGGGEQRGDLFRAQEPESTPVRLISMRRLSLPYTKHAPRRFCI